VAEQHGLRQFAGRSGRGGEVDLMKGSESLCAVLQISTHRTVLDPLVV